MSSYENPQFNQKYTPPTYRNLNEWYEATKNNKVSNPLGFDPIPYLCQLLKAANLPEVEPMVTMADDQPFDYENYLNSYFSTLTAIGDGRVNFYETWSEISKEYLPKILTQIELKQTGGCRVENGYICNADGIKMSKASSTCKEGDEYLEPILPEKIIEQVNTFVQAKRDISSDYFIEYIKRKYINDTNDKWSVVLFGVDEIKVFYVQASKIIEKETEDVDVDAKHTDPKTYSTKSFLYSEFLRYYYDSKEYVSEKLGIEIKTQPFMMIPATNADTDEPVRMLTALKEPIKDYSVLINSL